MSDANIKFIRVHGRVVPIHGDNVGKLRKGVRKTASDFVSRKDASKSLSKSAKRALKKSNAAASIMKFSFAASAGFAAASAMLPKKYRLGARLGAIGTGALGMIGHAGYQAGKHESIQLRRDAKAIAKGQSLAGTKQLIGAPAARARNYSSIFENRLKENQGLTPSAATINPMPPMQSAEIPPPVPQLPGTTSV